MGHQTYMVRGRTVATAATADHCVATLWNPSTTVRIIVYEIALCANAAPAASAGIYLRRASARGTAGSTVTPAIQNDVARLLAPPSGALLDLATYTGQPTFETLGLYGWTLAAVAASGLIIPFPRGIEVPVGTGLSIVTTNAVAIPASDVSFLWEE
jgi:hypothetical protein